MTRGRLRAWWRPFAVQVRQTCTLHDTPYRIAVGAFSGLATAFLPLFGQMLMGMGLSWLLRGNVLAAAPWTWITNPVTTPFIWYGCYRLGAALMPGHAALGWDAMRELVGRFAEMGFAEAVADGWRVVGKIWLPTLFGSIIVGLAVGALGFLLVRWAVARLHRRRAQRAEQWRTRLVPPDPGRTT